MLGSSSEDSSSIQEACGNSVGRSVPSGTIANLTGLMEENTSHGRQWKKGDEENKPQNKSPGLGGNRDFTKRKLPFILSNVSATTSSLKESEAPTLSRPFCMVLI
ncbi:uncharacterized protein LOC143669956 isoform X1 [Tamandua tetradactyla]|uniref:uncharacterized protein LOC143669956 isoform X1 n=1 Tax=Tamandua tetradactyla TaxID=48850 RepID=UPI00405491C9